MTGPFAFVSVCFRCLHNSFAQQFFKSLLRRCRCIAREPCIAITNRCQLLDTHFAHLSAPWGHQCAAMPPWAHQGAHFERLGCSPPPWGAHRSVTCRRRIGVWKIVGSPKTGWDQVPILSSWDPRCEAKKTMSPRTQKTRSKR